MKLEAVTGLAGLFLAITQLVFGQTNETSACASRRQSVVKRSAIIYSVIGSTPKQEAALRSQIQLMQPSVLPTRIVFLPHWKYLNAARGFQLSVPAGFGSVMFTHLPSRTVFIDGDRYQGPDWLGYWMAHELGHLATNSPCEDDAERAAREFRKQLKDSQNKAPL